MSEIDLGADVAKLADAPEVATLNPAGSNSAAGPIESESVVRGVATNASAGGNCPRAILVLLKKQIGCSVIFPSVNARRFSSNSSTIPSVIGLFVAPQGRRATWFDPISRSNRHSRSS